MPALVEIINRSLSKLGQPSVTSLTDLSPNPARALAMWPTVRQYLLRTYVWRFSKRPVTLAASTTTPSEDSGFDNQFDLPADYVRLVACIDPDAQIVGRAIYSNEDSLPIWYVFDNEDTSTYDPCFVEAAACYIAAELCLTVIPDMNVRRAIQADFASHIKLAKSIQSIENPALAQSETETFLQSRSAFTSQ